MKIGYACMNGTLDIGTKTFRLSSYSDEKLRQSIKDNLQGLMKMLEWNVEKGILFFRISSELVPFASHPVCKLDWRKEFKEELENIGKFIKKHKIRISMHPDQFVLINAKDSGIVQRSIAELEYHCGVLDIMNLEQDAKIQIHVGGAYGDKASAIQRFIDNYNKLPEKIKRRLAIENDDRLFSLQDCLDIHKATGVPIIFDNFHHACLNNGESLRDAALKAKETWKKRDGLFMCDYSSQQIGERKGKHAKTLDIYDFKKYIKDCDGIDRDIMLEIKDKEKSAQIAIEISKKR